MPTPDHVPQPVQRDQDPSALIHNTYAVDPAVVPPDPDHVSTVLAEQYLEERMHPNRGLSSISVAWVPSGWKLPGITRDVVGIKEVTRWEKTDEWLISPKVAMAVWATTFAISLSYPGIPDVADEMRAGAHDIYRWFKAPEPIHRQVPEVSHTPGKRTHIRLDVQTENTPGSAAVDPRVIRDFIAEIHAAQDDGSRLKTIEVTGHSSDDYGTNDSIGKRETPAQDFADDRARAYSGAITLRLPKAKVKEIVDQDVLTPQEKATAIKKAEANGFNGQDNIIDAIRAVESDQPAKRGLRKFITEHFTKKRGITLEADMVKPGKDIMTTKYVDKEFPGEDNPPENPDRDYHPFLIPLPWMRKRQSVSAFKDIKRWKFIPGRRLYRPEIVREDHEHAWVHLRPEALQADGTLVDAPWAQTRKFEILMREGRIADVLRADYMTPAGEKRSLRLMFVDESPDPDDQTVEKYGELLECFAALQKGELGRKISGIFVYSKKNAGLHGDAKRIGLGVDTQDDISTLGVCTPLLELIELHMPTLGKNFSPADLAHELNSFEGASFTLAHEGAGHGTDIHPQKAKLRRTRVLGIPNAHLIQGRVWRDTMNGLRPRLMNLFQRYPNPDIEFNVTYSVPDHNGEMVEINDVVKAGDRALDHAHQATIIDREPTAYSASSQAEHYAETAASVTSGITIPFKHAGIHPRQLRTKNGNTAAFETGYRPAMEGQRIFTDNVGALPREFPVAFPQPPFVGTAPYVQLTYTKPENDPLLRQLYIDSRTRPILRSRDMIGVLARIIRG